MDADALVKIRDEAQAEEQAQEVAEKQPGELDQAQAEPAFDPVQSLAGLLTATTMAADFAGFKNVAKLWSEDTCRGFAEKLVPVLQKYAWGQRLLNFLATGAGVEELALAAYAAPLALATWQAVKWDMATTPAKLGTGDIDGGATAGHQAGEA